MKITIKQAEKLIKLARDAISAVFKGKEEFDIPEEYKKEFKEERGVFVSLYVDEDLIGCIGFPEPDRPLADAVIDAAKGAAFEDPRFPPLKKEQMKDLRIELSILTEPKEIEVEKASDYPKKVKIGKDGLMIRDKFGAGLLLPQVAVEWGWKPKEFLDNACKKAGLSPDCWNNMRRNVYKFTAQVFSEEKGRIVEKKLKA
ncbi:TIGR00296 family protein [Candidatus Woesearchaeota archaeon]|nr:TIGR00296 family protein [Candidatus Woesearchaeota archaeon]